MSVEGVAHVIAVLISQSVHVLACTRALSKNFQALCLVFLNTHVKGILASVMMRGMYFANAVFAVGAREVALLATHHASILGSLNLQVTR